jgi:hypothetical protein
MHWFPGGKQGSQDWCFDGIRVSLVQIWCWYKIHLQDGKRETERLWRWQFSLRCSSLASLQESNKYVVTQVNNTGPLFRSQLYWIRFSWILLPFSGAGLCVLRPLSLSFQCVHSRLF